MCEKIGDKFKTKVQKPELDGNTAYAVKNLKEPCCYHFTCHAQTIYYQAGDKQDTI